MNNPEEHQVILFPRNFIERGTIFGGTFKIRNFLEALVLALGIGIPICSFVPAGLSAKIILLCMTALPASMLALIGVAGESLTAFFINALRFLCNRRILFRSDMLPPDKNHKWRPRNKEHKARGKKHQPKEPQKEKTAKENRTAEKAIFVDEVWQLIGTSSNRLAAEFVLEIAKIIRAYSGAGIFATQDLNDFFALDDGKYGKGIINNCKTKIVLNMEDEEAQRVQSILHLSETEVMNITHFQRGNGLISTNNNNITVEFKASTLEKELITTDRQELLKIIERQKQYAS